MPDTAPLKHETSLPGRAPATSPLQACPHCEALMDITEQEPLARLSCPGCGADIRVRDFIGHYHLIDVAGRGGMGVVYEAVDTSLARPVALKLLRKDHSNNQKLLDQLELEAAVTATINHPHVIKIYSTGVEQGRFYIVMELAGQGSLDDLIRKQGRVSEIQVLELAIQIAEGLRAAHQHGLIHRDVKPGNILFAEGHKAKIVDFGLAIFMAQEESMRGDVWGTPYYVAPEKLDSKPEDFRSDIYSLGAALYHALAGVPPFEAETASLVAVKRLKGQPISLQSAAAWVTAPTASIVNRALNKNPGDRFGSYDELIVHLEDAKMELDDFIGHPAPDPSRGWWDTEETRKLMIWLGVALLAFAFLVGGAFLF